MTDPIRVTVWNEFFHERQGGKAQEVYPSGLHTVIADGLRESLSEHVEVRTATLDQPEHGLTEAVLATTDVLTWWGHMRHQEVAEEVVARVQQRVLDGMGLVVLHSGHVSKIFQRLMGTTCYLNWREADETELVWTVAPSHEICQGVPHPIVIPKQEMYGEFFDIPQPDELIFISSFSKGGEVFRSGCAYRRGRGRVFYFSPGHETYPIYYQPEIRRVIANAVRWAYQREVSPIDTTTPRYEPAPIGWYQEPRAPLSSKT